MDTLLVYDTLDPSTWTLIWLPILMELWSLLTNLLWLLPVLITLLLRDLLTLLLDLLLPLLSPTVECTLMPSLLSTELVMDTLPTLVLWLIPMELWSLWTSLLYRQLELITSPSLDPPSTRERERERELVSHETYLLLGCVNSTQIVIVDYVCNIMIYN